MNAVALGYRLTVDPRTLTPLVLVRIQVPQPLFFNDLEIFVWNMPLVLREFRVTLREFHPSKPPVLGVVTLSAISLILAIDQQAKSLKSRTSVFAVIGKFRSI